MSITNVIATLACDGCACAMRVTLDPAEVITEEDLASEVLATFGAYQVYSTPYNARRESEELFGSVQGGYTLCRDCTAKVDDAINDVERLATAEEVRKCLGI